MANDLTIRDQYLDEGYCVARNLIPVAELESINREIAELFATQLRRLGQPVVPGESREAFHRNAIALLQADVPTYINTARITQMLPSVHRLLISEPIMKLVKGLGIDFPVISTRVSIHFMSDHLKIPNGYHKTPPHQDWRSIQGSLDCIVLWIPTTPVSARSHALEVVPKSHLLGLLPTAEHIMTPTVDAPSVTPDRFVPVPVQPGDAIAFSSFLVHRTGEQGDGLARIALSGRFNNAVESTFVKHGYPTPYSYSYRKDLMFENFPTIEDLQSVFPAASGA
ncbi:phytanoyl-CoA dioxygenase family protein [Paraburkholderia sp. SIMBA_049]